MQRHCDSGRTEKVACKLIYILGRQGGARLGVGASFRSVPIKQGVGASIQWVLVKPGGRSLLLVGARKSRELELPSSWYW